MYIIYTFLFYKSSIGNIGGLAAVTSRMWLLCTDLEQIFKSIDFWPKSAHRLLKRPILG